MKHRMIVALFILALSAVELYAQSVKITGLVVSKTDGEGLIGATVREVGTEQAALTDLDGNFVIEVQPGAELTFSYVGCESQTLKAVNGMRVELADMTTLQEVVVTGY